MPAGFDVGSRVHEYGGGAYLPVGTTLFACSQGDQRLYRIDEGRSPVPITPVPPMPASLRYADLRVMWAGQLLVCVRERHQGGEVVNELVALPADGSADPWVLASGHDFYAAPRPSPDGRRLAWLDLGPAMHAVGWRRPVGRRPRSGRAAGPSQARRRRPFMSPSCSPSGTRRASCTSSRTGPAGGTCTASATARWSRCCRWRPSSPTPPGSSTTPAMRSLADGRIACRYRQHGRDRLALLDPETGRLTDLPIPYTSIKPYLRALGDRLAFIGASPTASSAVATLHVPTGHLDVLAGAEVSLDPAWVSVPQPIQFPTQDGQTAHGLYYPPTNPEVTGPADARPPLLVQAHPGPTADAKARLDLRIQFFTSRGFAVVEVNYAGSTGYGRAYRERLTGQWGVLDVADCLDAARSLVQAGEVDGRRLVISGESAGGFTALCALASEDLLRRRHQPVRHRRSGDLPPAGPQVPGPRARPAGWPLSRGGRPPTGPAHRCMPSTGSPAPCCWCMGWRTPSCRRPRPRSWPRRLSAGASGTCLLTFQGEGHGFRRPEQHPACARG